MYHTFLSICILILEKIYSQKKVAYKTTHAVSNLRGLDGRGQLKTIFISLERRALYTNIEK